MLAVTTFGDRLKDAVKSSPYTQRDLAGVLDVREATVSDWANDKYLPAGEHLVRLPDLLDVDAEWLLTGRGEKKRRRPEDSERRLHVIRMLATGDEAGAIRALIEEWPD